MAVARWAVLVLASLAGACLSAFAPAIRVHGVHRDVRSDSDAASCTACHPVEGEPGATHAPGRGQASTVPQWMMEDRRGCLGCHALRSGHAR